MFGEVTFDDMLGGTGCRYDAHALFLGVGTMNTLFRASVDHTYSQREPERVFIAPRRTCVVM